MTRRPTPAPTGRLLPLANAFLEIDRAVRPVAGREIVALGAAVGRVLAADVRSDVDSPPFDRSAVDGYAVRSRDARAPEARLRVVATVAAGSRSSGTSRLRAGEAARVFTGAPVPPGADAVVMQEATDAADRSAPVGATVTLRAPVEAGQNVAPRGQELRRGVLALRRGAVVGPPEVAVLAAVGRVRVPVRRAITVAVLATGDELVAASRKPGPSRIRNSNGPSVSALLRSALPVRVTDLGIVRDDPRALARAVRAGLRHDLLVLSGGVSVGDRDFVAGALAAAGVETIFHRVRLKPAKPSLFGRRGRSYVVGLPGNPVSSFVAAELFAKRVVRRLAGIAEPPSRLVAARTAVALKAGSEREEYRPARAWIDADDGTLLVEPVAFQGSSDFPGLGAAQAFIVVPPGAAATPAGRPVRVHLLAGRGALA